MNLQITCILMNFPYNIKLHVISDDITCNFTLYMHDITSNFILYVKLFVQNDIIWKLFISYPKIILQVILLVNYKSKVLSA